MTSPLIVLEYFEAASSTSLNILYAMIFPSSAREITPIGVTIKLADAIFST